MMFEMALVWSTVSIFQCPPLSSGHCPTLSGKCPQPCALCPPVCPPLCPPVCPRGSQRQKRSQSLDNGRLCRATQLSDADGSFSERVNRSPPCIETCIIWHLDSLQESVVGGVALRGGFQYLGALTTPLSVKSLHRRQSQKLVKICSCSVPSSMKTCSNSSSQVG